MQNICDGKMLSHSLTHSMHFNYLSKINKNQLNETFFIASNLLVNPNGLPIFPNTELTELWRNELKEKICANSGDHTLDFIFLSGSLLFQDNEQG